MSVGYSVGAVCYSTSAQAVDAYYSGQPTATLISSTDVVQSVYQKDIGSSTWFLEKITYTSNGTRTLNWYYAHPLSETFGSCTLPNSPFENFTDGSVLGWGIAAAMVLAWGVSLIRKGL